MAQYWEDWTGQTVDAEPTGWTVRYASVGVVYAIKADVDAPAGKSLKITRSNTARRLLSWDAVDSDGGRATLSVRALVRHNSPTPSGVAPYLGICGRGGGAAASESGVVAYLTDAGKSIRIHQYSSGTSSILETSATGAWNVGTVYWLGLDVDGTTATVTIAPANDPDNPTVTITDTVSVTAAGWVGFFTFTAGDFDVLAIGVGTGGDPAPTSAPSSEASLSASQSVGSVTQSASAGVFASASASQSVAAFGQSAEVDVETPEAGLTAAQSVGTFGQSASAAADASLQAAQTVAAFSQDATVEAVAEAITVITDIDGGNVDPDAVVITDATSDTPTIYCDVRESTKVRSWRHFMFAVEGAEGKSPVFQFNLATREYPASVAADWSPVYTTTPEDHTSWVRATSRTFVGGTAGVLEWSFDAPLPAGRVYIADLPMGRQADVEALAAELLLESYASPAASADEDGVYYTSPAATDDLGRAIGGHPMYAIKLAWPGTATTDGGPKRQLVVLTHIHAAGEACSWVPFRYWLDWVLGASSEAAAFRANWDLHLYMGLTPNGLYAGYKRQGDRNFDPNRVWAGASTLVEIEATKAAITTDLNLPTGRFDALYSWHGWVQKTNAWNAYVAYPTDTDSGTRSPQMQAMIDTGASIFGESLGTPASSGTSNTDVWWARANGASVAFDTEVGQSIPSTHTFLKSVGENWGKLLQAVDAAGEFWDSGIWATQPVGAFTQSASVAVVASASAAQAVGQFTQSAAAGAVASAAATQAVGGFAQAANIAADAGVSASQLVGDFGQVAALAADDTATIIAAQAVGPFGPAAALTVDLSLQAGQPVAAFGQAAQAIVLPVAGLSAAQTVAGFGQSVQVDAGEAPANLEAAQQIGGFVQQATAQALVAAAADQTIGPFGQEARLITVTVNASADQQVGDFGQAAELGALPFVMGRLAARAAVRPSIAGAPRAVPSLRGNRGVR